MRKEYTSVQGISGHLLIVENTEDIKYGEIAAIKQSNGVKRYGQVIAAENDTALIYLFECSRGLSISDTAVKFLGHPMRLDVSPDMFGRVFDGFGNPKDSGAPIIPSAQPDINGFPINPAAREYPYEFIQTGISVIDGMNPIVCGQKLSIFSGNGLPHTQLAAQIARQARLRNSDDRFAVVFAAVGISFDDIDYLVNDFKETGVTDRAITFISMANAPAAERIAAPRSAITTAEYLAYTLGMNVLVIINDITGYAEALREVSAASKKKLGDRGYPICLRTDLSSMYERAGKLKNKKGSITIIPMLSMPENDITHPVPDSAGSITEGQLLLSHELHSRSINPPINVLASMSSYRYNGIGEDKTREDHADIMNKLRESYFRGKEATATRDMLGVAALSDTDRAYCEFANVFEKEYISQGYYKNRDILQTLELGWKLLEIIPKAELKYSPCEEHTENIPEILNDTQDGQGG